MRYSYLYLFILFFFTAHLPAQSAAVQPDTMKLKIELTDGSVLLGQIVSESETEIWFRTFSGAELTLKKEIIAKQEKIAGRKKGNRFLRDDPNRTRLFFAPTGRALKTGQGYFSVYQIFFPFVAVGVTDYLTLAGGLSLLPFADSQLLYVAPRLTPVQKENFDISAGVLIIKIPEEDEPVGILYSVSTFGDRRLSLTVGLGFAYAGGDVADKPVLLLGGELQTSGRTKIISENWIIPDSEVQILSFGWRFFGENLAADFSLMYPAGSDIEGFPFIPWVGFAYNFGQVK